MIASVQANRPQWSGRGFEIWFFVVLIPGVDRALWVRLTRFANDSSSDARVWAVVSERGAITAARTIHPLDAMSTENDAGEFCVRVGATEFGHGHAKGSCGSSDGVIRWELSYAASDPLIQRVPKIPSFVPLGTYATHPHADATVTGWVELNGQRLDLDGGLLTQMHIWGQKRLEWLRWIWAPQLQSSAAGTLATLELTAVAPKAGGANLCVLWLDLGGEVLETGLTKAARVNVESVRAGVLHHVGSYAGRRLLVRAWAPPTTYAGWDYRMLGGGDLHVAQTNLGRVEVEVYERVGLGWLPKQRLRSSCAAIEFHGPQDYEAFSYVGWDEPEAKHRARAITAGSEPDPDPDPAPQPSGPGEWIDTPAPTRIIALGLTYKAHAKETASGLDPVVFEKDPAAWSAGDGEIIRPSSSRLRAALEALDPKLSAAMAEFGFIPAMLDYEVELGLVLLDGLEHPSKLDTLASGGRVALVVANDVTARSVQVLGEGQADRLAYWSAAKSLPGFAPTSAKAWVPERFDLDAWPPLRLETRVNGTVRQDAGLELLIETPRQMLGRVCEARGEIPPGTLLLTGTPAGVAFSVPRWKRVMGERLLDRLGKLRAAIGSFSTSTMFLRPGDVVAVSAGFLGAIEHTVSVELEA